MDGPPPPPPPHGEKPNTTHGEYRKTSDLPEGNYDIFIVPPHSSGSGFLYLPSLQCHRNSFIAGSVSTFFVVLLWSLLSPISKTWYIANAGGGGGAGGMGIALLGIGVGIAGWIYGALQGTSRGGGGGFGGFGSRGSGPGGAGSQSQSAGAGANHSKGAEAGGQNGQQQHNDGGNSGSGPNPNSQYTGNQHGTGGPPPNAPPNSDPPPNTGAGASAGSKPNSNQKKENGNADWDRAREETSRKEELRRKMEEFKRKREAEAREKEKQREHEAMDREIRERKEKFEKEMAAAREAAARESRQRAEKEAAEAREREEKAAAKSKAERQAAEKEAAAKAAAKKEADAKFAALKEAAAKKYAEKKAKDALEAAAKEAAAGKEAASKASSTTSAPPPRSPSPKKPPSSAGPKSTATDSEDPSSFKPYERVRRPYGGATTSESSTQSKSSYTPSQSTAWTSPPPSNRGGYSTKDPDKIVISGVFAFNNNFVESPVAQLVSGQGMVTDGLVLRITTEGLFIDDDIRGIPQREWDTKAWTMKMVEAWCSQYAASPQARQTPSKSSNPFRRSAPPGPSPEESDAYLGNLLKACKNTCRLGSPGCFSRNGSDIDNALSSGLHVLRASFRDQDGKRYVFVLHETEGWKVAIGLQRLRRGTQVRSLGVASMAVNDCRSLLENLGYV